MVLPATLAGVGEFGGGLLTALGLFGPVGLPRWASRRSTPEVVGAALAATVVGGLSAIALRRAGADGTRG